MDQMAIDNRGNGVSSSSSVSPWCLLAFSRIITYNRDINYKSQAENEKKQRKKIAF